ncbi:hypothetical protein NX059_000906 [Plenodomus lindquistii]|nr:hypothetical protein NX059_000906 [Plenodomus lindquistii]
MSDKSRATSPEGYMVFLHPGQDLTPDPLSVDQEEPVKESPTLEPLDITSTRAGLASDPTASHDLSDASSVTSSNYSSAGSSDYSSDTTVDYSSVTDSDSEEEPVEASASAPNLPPDVLQILLSGEGLPSGFTS